MQTLAKHVIGFTLIEVVVALTVAALLTTVAAPAVGLALDRVRMNGGVRELAAAIKATRLEARRSGADALFTLDVDQHAYRALGGDRKLNVPQAATLTLLTAESERLGESAGAIRFFPDGSSTGGTISLVYRDQSQRVEVDWLTGHVRVVSR